MKRVESLRINDIRKHPVWEYVNDDKLGETVVRPHDQLPVRNLNGRVAGTRIHLANCSHVWALIGNVDTHNPRLTEHFLTLSVYRNRRWFVLARYHDFDYDDHGPAALASFLEMSIDEVFPISYDLSEVAEGDPAALIGRILKEPRERLPRAELIAMAVGRS